MEVWHIHHGITMIIGGITNGDTELTTTTVPIMVVVIQPEMKCPDWQTGKEQTAQKIKSRTAEISNLIGSVETEAGTVTPAANMSGQWRPGKNSQVEDSHKENNPWPTTIDGSMIIAFVNTKLISPMAAESSCANSQETGHKMPGFLGIWIDKIRQDRIATQKTTCHRGSAIQPNGTGAIMTTEGWQVILIVLCAWISLSNRTAASPQIKGVPVNRIDISPMAINQVKTNQGRLAHKKVEISLWTAAVKSKAKERKINTVQIISVWPQSTNCWWLWFYSLKGCRKSANHVK